MLGGQPGELLNLSGQAAMLLMLPLPQPLSFRLLPFYLVPFLPLSPSLSLSLSLSLSVRYVHLPTPC